MQFPMATVKKNALYTYMLAHQTLVAQLLILTWLAK
jgi:hypothetical protein